MGMVCLPRLFLLLQLVFLPSVSFRWFPTRSIIPTSIHQDPCRGSRLFTRPLGKYQENGGDDSIQPQNQRFEYTKSLYFHHGVVKMWEFHKGWYVYISFDGTVSVMHWEPKDSIFVPFFTHPLLSKDYVFIDCDLLIPQILDSQGDVSSFPQVLLTVFDTKKDIFLILHLDTTQFTIWNTCTSPIRFCKWISSNRRDDYGVVVIQVSGKVQLYHLAQTMKQRTILISSLQLRTEYDFTDTIHQVFVMDHLVFLCGCHGHFDCVEFHSNGVRRQQFILDIDETLSSPPIIHWTLSRQPIPFPQHPLITPILVCIRVSLLLHQPQFPLSTFSCFYHGNATWTVHPEPQSVWCGPLSPWISSTRFTDYVKQNIYPIQESNSDLHHVVISSGCVLYIYSIHSPLSTCTPCTSHVWFLHIRPMGDHAIQQFPEQRWYKVSTCIETIWTREMIFIPTDKDKKQWLAMTYRQLFTSPLVQPWYQTTISMEQKMAKTDDDSSNGLWSFLHSDS